MININEIITTKTIQEKIEDIEDGFISDRNLQCEGIINFPEFQNSFREFKETILEYMDATSKLQDICDLEEYIIMHNAEMISEISAYEIDTHCKECNLGNKRPDWCESCDDCREEIETAVYEYYSYNGYIEIYESMSLLIDLLGISILVHSDDISTTDIEDIAKHFYAHENYLVMNKDGKVYANDAQLTLFKEFALGSDAKIESPLFISSLA